MQLKSSAKQKQNKNQKHTQARREERPKMTQQGEDSSGQSSRQVDTDQDGTRWSNMEQTGVDKRENKD